MTMGTFVALLLAAAAATYIVAPLFRSDAAMEERRTRNLSEEEALVSEREMSVAALRDLEDDRATGKIGDDDYAGSKTQLTERAIDVMKQLDELQSRRDHPRPEGVPSHSRNDES